jgi:Zn-dependent peptidase ImmA (M78 family)/DNA-binding XRE family transcriptional regulator
VNVNITAGRDKRVLSRPIPERIKEAREARGLTVEAFADSLGVTRQTVAQYETGQIAPSGEALAKIIALTALPPLFFARPRERTGLGTPFWRGLKRMEQYHRRRISRRLEWARDITSYLERFIQIPAVNLPSIAFNFEADGSHQIEIAAEELRDFWGLGRGPIRDLPLILEKNGIVLVREAVDCPDMDAVSCWQGGRPFLLFSSQITSGPRSLYNLSHELGHVLLHAGVEITTKNLDRIEKQANRFAGAFLLPRETFSEEILGNSVSYFKALKRRWGVAIAAMAYRCKDLGILTGNQYAYLLRQMNALRIRKEEPLDDILAIRNPCLLSESIKMLLDHGVQTREQLEDALKLNLRDVESLCGVPAGYLDTLVIPFQPRPKVRPA